MALLLLLPFLILVGSAGAGDGEGDSAPSAATALFVLGDSTASCAATTLPLNLTTSFSSPCVFHHSGARRRLIPDLLAAKMGLPPPPAISTLNGTAAAAAQGVNFGDSSDIDPRAITNAPTNNNAGVFRMGAVGQQLRLATETLQLLRLESPSPAAAAAALSSSLFVVSFGSDAYARLLGRGTEADAWAPKHGRRGFARLLAGRVGRAVQELYEAGARRVAVLAVGPLGCAPRVMWEGLHLVDNNAGGGCVEEANELVQAYNGRVEAVLDELRPSLPGADLVFCDVYKAVMEMISNPGAYGFEEAREACCGLGPFGGTIGCLTREMACPTPQGHIWWDLYSLTGTANSLLVDWAWAAPPSAASNLSNLCRPVTLQQLAGWRADNS
ncbi:GDSL esterase/lipase At1g71250 [Brachypodium distachyon]|uniref:GDSL esterase/lipase n=1 Tax=Brachypodium distachyon TaxID=15368 RepID=I1IUU8_BRADI|nr:GDSL esterase/lipase At1g71250 [Brachypodium distachyon]KQJ92475.1 hypothetical protein BRADI_4g43890v3 [Brachypodium distachyon]|eukprot:XP_010239546.2 GDSL esterase/lipase At1g71250 [Brachypodium distachyon]